MKPNTERALMDRIILAIASLLVASGLAALPASADATSSNSPPDARSAARSCSVRATDTVQIVRASNMACNRAARVMRRYDGSIGKHFRAGHFRCRWLTGMHLVGNWGCRNGRKSFRFGFAD